MIELVIAIGIISILAALIVPAVYSSRERARQIQCVSNLRQLGVAIQLYESVHRMFPPGASNRASLHVAILPHIDQDILFQKFDYSSRRDPGRLLRETVIDLFVCPGETAPNAYSGDSGRIAATSYAGNIGTGLIPGGMNGMFRYLDGAKLSSSRGPIRAADIRDGLSNTACLAEILHADGTGDRLRVNWQTPKEYPTLAEWNEFRRTCSRIPPSPMNYGWVGDEFMRGLPWTEGNTGFTLYNHAGTPNTPSCLNSTKVQEGVFSAASPHSGGVNLLMADGHVKFVADSIDTDVWTELGSRAGSDGSD